MACSTLNRMAPVFPLKALSVSAVFVPGESVSTIPGSLVITASLAGCASQ